MTHDEIKTACSAQVQLHSIQPKIDVLEVAKELEASACAFGDTKNKAKKNAAFYLRSQFERIEYLEQQVRELLAEQPKPPEMKSNSAEFDGIKTVPQAQEKQQ